MPGTACHFMTLSKAIEKLRTRFNVDQDSEVDVDDNDVMTSALMDAAEKVSEHSYLLWTSNATITLTAATTGGDPGAEPDLLSTAVSGTGAAARPIFHVYGVYVNGGWLTEEEIPSEFFARYSDYVQCLANAHPGVYTKIAPSSIRLYPPPNAAAAAATNYARGFYRHPRYTYLANHDTELLGPDEFHELVVDRAYLDNSKSYAAGAGLQRRATVQNDYDAKTAEYRQRQLELYKPARRRDGAGRHKRMIYLGGIGV